MSNTDVQEVVVNYEVNEAASGWYYSVSITKEPHTVHFHCDSVYQDFDECKAVADSVIEIGREIVSKLETVKTI